MSESKSPEPTSVISPKKITLLRCLVAATLSGGLAIAIYSLTISIVQTYADKPVTSANPVVVNLTVAVRTIVIGMAALGDWGFWFGSGWFAAIGYSSND